MRFPRNLRRLESFKRIQGWLWRDKQYERAPKSRDHETPSRTLRLGQGSQRTMSFKGILDSGCAVRDLISEEVVSALDLWSEVESRHEVIGTCLNGSDLISVGTIVLRVNGLGLCKIFNTCFYVVAGESLSWQVVLGASTCTTHHLIKVGAYGLRMVQTKKSKAEEAAEKARMEEHKRRVAANETEVKKHKKRNTDGEQQHTSVRP